MNLISVVLDILEFCDYSIQFHVAVLDASGSTPLHNAGSPKTNSELSKYVIMKMEGYCSGVCFCDV